MIKYRANFLDLSSILPVSDQFFMDYSNLWRFVAPSTGDTALFLSNIARMLG